MAQRKSKKPHQKPGTDSLVWFSPVSGPFLSPGREKAISASRRKALPSSIFSIPPLDKTRKKQQQGIELEEPTSPKVSCIGQVRTSKKKDKREGFSRENSVFEGRSRPGSASPARFFTSPGRQLKWASLFGSRKESSSSSISAAYGGEASCLGLSCDSPSVLGSYREGRNCGAFLAKSLMLLQECGHASEHDALRDPSGEQDVRYSHSYQERHWPAFSALDCQAASHEQQKYQDAEEPANKHSDSYAKDTPPTDSNQSMVQCKDIMDAVEQGVSSHNPAGSNIKISLDIVPETWLCRGDESSMPDSAQQLQCETQWSSIKAGEFCQVNDKISSDLSNNEAAPMSVDGKDCPGRDSRLITRTAAMAAESLPHVSLQQCIQAQVSGGRQRYNTAFAGSKSTDLVHDLTNSSLGMCKGKSSDTLHALEPYGVILVGYKLQSLSLPVNKKILVDREGLKKHGLKGSFEVGRLSFQGVGTDSQWLKGEAEFIRSFSATSYRTVIRLRRSKSEPSRPFH